MNSSPNYCHHQIFTNTFTPLWIREETYIKNIAVNSDNIDAYYCKETGICSGDMEENPVKWTVLIANISDSVILGFAF